jgi:acetylornithine deacetylase/succinyl-diaminopimelate desuccinylase-like protein
LSDAEPRVDGTRLRADLTAMIFVPSHEGRSHSPAEHTDWRDVENGANVLLATLVDLATASR